MCVKEVHEPFFVLILLHLAKKQKNKNTIIEISPN